MNVVSIIMACFSLLGAFDRIIGNRFGIGKEFEKGILITGNLALSMTGMIIIAPVIAEMANPIINFIKEFTPIDPSIIPSLILANDMGGAPLAKELALSPEMGYFNGLVVASMIGATISFTIPFSLEVVKKEQQTDLLTGILCGIVTMPVGCFVAGLIQKIPLLPLIFDIITLVVFSLIITFGLLFFSEACIKTFMVLGKIIKILITLGLALGIFRFLTGAEIIKGLATFEEGSEVIFNIGAVMTGAFPLIYILSKIFTKPLRFVGDKLNINEVSAMGILSTLATNITAFNNMKDMDSKGVIINSAFAVSAAFVFADHLAFTLAFCPDYLPGVIVGKLVSGITAIVAALLISNE